jgi:hypothetical protein
MTVPTHFRRSGEIPGIFVLHYASLPEDDVQTSQSFKFTRPLRTILDLIDAGTVEPRFVRQALRQGSGSRADRAPPDSRQTSHRSGAQDVRRGHASSFRRQVSFDRLLARLFHGKTVPWILKGGTRSNSASATPGQPWTSTSRWTWSSRHLQTLVTSTRSYRECCREPLTHFSVTGSTTSSDRLSWI